MRNEFVKHIHDENFFSAGEKVLLALSGGVDSVVLLHLLKEIDVQVFAAHINYKLRDEAAEKDQIFVENLCKKLAVPLEVLTIDTKAESEQRKKGIQEVAREIRYDWFDELLPKLGCTKLLTAHHKDDSIETFFINLIRGTGVKGLTGIHKNRNQICRPLLFATKVEIEDFAKKESIAFRQDTSNFEDKYLRNNVRINILPKFKETRPSFIHTMEKNMQRMHHAQDALEYAVDEIKQKYVKENEGEILIDKELIKVKGRAYFLYALLRDFGFNESQVEDVLADIPVGKKIIGTSAVLYVERDCLKIKKSNTLLNENISFGIDRDFIVDKLPIQLSFSEEEISNFSLNKSPAYAFLDSDKLIFPLTLRKWQDGDKFKPLGMHGKKLISDFLAQEKVQNSEKRNQWILMSNGEIVWVVGHRISNDFKIGEKTKRFLKIRFDEK